MRTISVCPATLQPGYDTYSPMALKLLFGGEKVSPFLDFEFDGISANSDLQVNQRNLSISGAQEKYSAVVERGHIRLSQLGEQGTFILKPAPLLNIQTRKQIPANEHLTIQIASQVYGIETALDIEPSDALLRTGHLCRTDFERFGKRIGLPAKRVERVLNLFMKFPPMVNDLVARSFLNDKMKRNYWRIINQRCQWFVRSE